MNNYMNLDNFKCKLIPLTPIHIGSGNDIEPYDYVIKSGMFYRINSMDIFDKLSEKEQEVFTNKIKEGLIPFRAYVRDIYKEEFGYIYKSSVDKNFENKYNQKLDGTKSRNENSEFLIKEFMGGLRGKYIAGSSLKGSIRGAYIYDKLSNGVNYKLERNTRVKTMPSVLYDNYSKPITSKKIKADMDKDFDKQAFEMKNISPFTDPFKRLTITDTREYSDISKVVECKRVSINKETTELKNGSSDYLEVLKSKYADEVENFLEFSMSIRYLGKEGRALIKDLYDSKNKSFGEILTFDETEIIDAINAKMREVLEEEVKFYNRTTNTGIKALYEELQKEFDSLEDNEAIIRIGKGSGFATFTHFLKSNNAKDKSLHSASRVLAEGNYPMGWAKIVIGE